MITTENLNLVSNWNCRVLRETIVSLREPDLQLKIITQKSIYLYMKEYLVKILKYAVIPWILWFIIVFTSGKILKSYRPELNQVYEITWGAFAGLIFIVIFLLSFKFTGALKKDLSLYIFKRFPLYIWNRFVFIITIVGAIIAIVFWIRIIINT